MPKQEVRPDIYILPLTPRGDELVKTVTDSHEKAGQVVTVNVEEIAGVKVQMVRVFGKRPEEGKIAAYMRSKTVRQLIQEEEND